MVGFCGGFTTFSSFSLQSYELLQSGRMAAALAYMAGSVAFCLIGTALGWAIGRG
jgi:CrcB protein